MGEYLVGLISDTHGTIGRQALDVLAGCDLVLHAGDVGRSSVLRALRRIAPVVAVRGNMDKGGWARRLPKTQVAEVGGIRLYVLHDLYQLDLDPAAAGFAAVINGHTHRPAVVKRNGVLFVNPGSAGPSRYDLPPSVALLEIDEGELSARVIYLDRE